MYPGTVVNYIDNSQITVLDADEDQSRRPLFLVANSFEKGPEKLTTVIGDEFFNLYGTSMKFEKHGQANLQAAKMAQAGAQLWVKRLVNDEQATLGNVVFAASVDEGYKIQKNAYGGFEYVYKKAGGGETTIVSEADIDTETGKPIHVTDDKRAKITWKKYSIENAKTFNEVKSAIGTTIESGETGVIIITDNGRSNIIKAVRFVPDYNVSRGVGQIFYNIRVYEGSDELAREMVTLNPYVIYDDVSYAMTKDTTNHIVPYTDPQAYDELINKLVDQLNANKGDGETLVTKEQVMGLDLLFGYDAKGNPSDLIDVEIDDSNENGGFDFNASYGVELPGGNDGFYTTAEGSTVRESTLIYDPEDPYSATSDLMVDFYSGANDEDEEIYDIDNHRLFGIVDANFPQPVKDAIVKYMGFRNDSFYFRDLGIAGTDTFLGIREAKYKQIGGDYENNFIFGDYSTWGEVYDPETRKRIKVTMMYDMCSLLTQHYIQNPFSPTAGIINGFILTSFIPDTINFIPLKKPNVNYKQAMTDIAVNYASYEDGNLVVQSLYTNKGAETQLLYASNVLAMQEIGRRVAEVCPECRFELNVSGQEFSEYRKKINRVLENYQGFFNTLELVYTSDPIRTAQKIFYAAINFQFGDWAQSEIFDLVANPSSISALQTSDEQ